MTVEPITVHGPATAYGWMRRGDLVHPTLDVWERPDGMLLATPKGSPPPTLVTLNFQVRPDEDT